MNAQERSSRAEPTSAIRVVVNDREYERTAPVRKTLADFLREDLGLTGSHLGCEHGVCGACTVVFEGEIVRSCLMLAVQADGGTITTIEGIGGGEPGGLHPVQQAFWDRHGLQCGFCTPGMVLAAIDFLRDHPNPTREEIREGMAGNLCRCTGYQFIVDAVQAAGQALQARGVETVSTGGEQA